MMAEHEQMAAQPLMTHLIELRKRLMYAIAVFLIATGICYFFAEHIYAFLTQPLADQKALAGSGEHRLIYTGLTEAFTTYLKLAFFSGAVVTVPFVMLQIWMFMAPGLYPHERRSILPYFLVAPLLFIMGAALCFYGVIPVAWRFFLSFETPSPTIGMPIVLEARVAEYLGLTTTLIFAFGLAFQLPIVLGLLGRLGVVKAAMLARFRKWALVLVLIMAAVLTPPDILSQLALGIPLYCLYEMSIVLVRAQERSKTEGQHV